MASRTIFSMFSRKRRGKFVSSIIFCLALAAGASAQNPVSWSLSATKPIKAGARLDVRLSANISGAWYLYSLTQPAGGPNVTRITVSSEPTFKLAARFGLFSRDYSDIHLARNALSGFRWRGGN